MKRTVLIPIDTDTQANKPKEVKHMSQKYQALQAYTAQKESYNMQT